MTFTVNYQVPDEVQTGAINVSINFVNDKDNSAVYIPNNANLGEFSLVDGEGNDINGDFYEIKIEPAVSSDYRELRIIPNDNFPGSISFTIKFEQASGLIGNTVEDSRSSSGEVSPRANKDIPPSFPIRYHNPEDESTTQSEPPPTEVVIEEAIVAKGPEITQSGGVIQTDPPEEESEPEPPELVVRIGQYPLSPITFDKNDFAFSPNPETRTLGFFAQVTLQYTWLTQDEIPVPVEWGGPSNIEVVDKLILDLPERDYESALDVPGLDSTIANVPYLRQLLDVEENRERGPTAADLDRALRADLFPDSFDELVLATGGTPRYFPISPQGVPTAYFTQRILIPAQAVGTIELTISKNSARGVLDEPPRAIVTGPSGDFTYTIDYDTRFSQVSPITVYITIPAKTPVRSISVPIRFRWTAPLTPNSFQAKHITATAKNLEGTDVDLIRDELIRLSAHQFEMLISFEQDKDGSTNTVSTGEVTIQVEADCGQSKSGGQGPPEPVEATFRYNLNLPPVDTEVAGGSLVCSITKTFDNNYFLDKLKPGLGEGEHFGGGFSGVSDLTFINKDGKKYLYGMMQVRMKLGGASPAIQRDRASYINGHGGGALFQMDVTTTGSGKHCPTEIVKAYPRFVAGARSLVEFKDPKGDKTGDGQLLFFYEGTHQAESVIGTSKQESIDWRKDAGHLRAFRPGDSNIKKKDPTIDYGRSWELVGEVEFTDSSHLENLYEESVFLKHKATSAPLVQVKNDLYLYTGTGDLRYVSDSDFEGDDNAQRLKELSTVPDNWILLKHSKHLDYRLPHLLTNQKKGYDILNEFAKLTGSYIGAYGRTIFYHPKYPRRAKLADSLCETSTTIDYEQKTREFPKPGPGKRDFILIEESRPDEDLKQEIIQYTAVRETQITIADNNGRGQFATCQQPFPYPDHTYIYHVNYVFDMDANHFIRPINEMNFRTDFAQLYNQFKIRYATVNPPLRQENVEYYLENRESVILNGGKELEIEVPELDERHKQWVEWLGDFYTNFYSNLHYITNLTVVGSFHFQLGDLVLLRESTLSQMKEYRKLQVLQVSQNKEENTTSLQLRTI